MYLKKKLSHIIKNMNLRANSNIGSGGNDEKCLHKRIITRFLCIVDNTRMIFEHVGYVLHWSMYKISYYFCCSRVMNGRRELFLPPLKSACPIVGTPKIFMMLKWQSLARNGVMTFPVWLFFLECGLNYFYPVVWVLRHTVVKQKGGWYRFR